MNAKTKPHVPANKAVYTEVPPNPKRMIHALREMGYTSHDALLDLIDNSIDAKATRIDVTIKEISKGVLVIDILDNGVGMDKPTLNQALRFGSETEHDAGVDLGKYGMGLNSAGISLARNIWVLTRQKAAQAYEATFDLATIERENRFVVILHEASGKRVFDTIGDQGTLVRLSQIDRINDTNVQRFAASLRPKIGQVYRHFINRGVVFAVNNRRVEAIDPLMTKHELTKVVLDQNIELAAGKTAHLKVVELPDLGPDNADYGILPRNSGIYVVRNGRQIMEAQTFGFKGIVTHHHSYTGFRAELSFDGTLDGDFHVDVKKGTIHPDHRMLERLRLKLEPLIEESGRSGRDWAAKQVVKLSHTVAEERLATRLAPAKPAKHEPKGKATSEPAQPAPKPVEFKQAEMNGTNGSRFYTAEQQDGRTVITYNTKHPFVQHVAKQPGTAPIVDVLTYAFAQMERDGVPGVNKLIDKLGEFLTTMYAHKE